MEITAEVFAEFSLTVTGAFSKAYKAPIPRGEYQPLEPDEPASMDDVAVTGFCIQAHQGGKWVDVDLLKDIPRTPEILTLLTRLAEAVDVEAREALWEAISDG